MAWYWGRTCQISTSQKVSLEHMECTIRWQVLALVPSEDICEVLEAYFHLGSNDKQLEEHLKDHYDTEVYGLGYMSYFCSGSLAQLCCAVENWLSATEALERSSAEAHFGIDSYCRCWDIGRNILQLFPWWPRVILDQRTTVLRTFILLPAMSSIRCFQALYSIAGSGRRTMLDLKPTGHSSVRILRRFEEVRSVCSNEKSISNSHHLSGLRQSASALRPYFPLSQPPYFWVVWVLWASLFQEHVSY